MRIRKRCSKLTNSEREQQLGNAFNQLINKDNNKKERDECHLSSDDLSDSDIIELDT